MLPAAGVSATQNIYNTIWRYNLGNETGALYALDILCYPGCGGKTGRYWPTQFASMYSWASIGEGNYNGGQLVLRHAMSHGFQMELSYTYAKSMDMGSDAERTVYSSSTGSTVGSSFQRYPERLESPAQLRSVGLRRPSPGYRQLDCSASVWTRQVDL